MDFYSNNFFEIDQSLLLNIPSKIKNDIDELFIQKINESILVYEVYENLKIMLINHPQYSPEGVNENTGSIFGENNLPIYQTSNIMFRSLLSSTTEKYINSKLLYSKLKMNLNNNGLKSKNASFYFSLFRIIENSEKNLGINLKTGNNDIFVKTFIPFYSSRDRFFTLLTENDEKLFLFIYKILEYYLSLSYNHWNILEIHRNIIISILTSIWNQTQLSQLNYTSINNLLLIFPLKIIDLNQFILKIKKKYVISTFIIYVLEKHKSFFYDFIKSNNLFNLEKDETMIFSDLV